MNDLYPNNSFGPSSDSDGFAEILSRIERIDASMRAAHMTEDGEQKEGRKKLKKRLRTLEKDNETLKAENEKLMLYLQFYAMQQQPQKKKKGKGKGKSKPVWWHDAIARSMPVVMNNLTQARPLLPDKNPIYLSDSRDRK